MVVFYPVLGGKTDKLSKKMNQMLERGGVKKKRGGVSIFITFRNIFFFLFAFTLLAFVALPGKVDLEEDY